MPYFQIADFRGGLDARRSRDLAPPGTLRVLKNAFINEGAEIEKRGEFVKDDDLTALLQGATVAANIAAGNPADADDRPIGPFPGLTSTQVLFCGTKAGWAGAQQVLPAVAGLPTPTAHYTRLFTSGGADYGSVGRIRTLSASEFDTSLFLTTSINGQTRHHYPELAPGNPVSVNQLTGVNGDFAITHRRKVYSVDQSWLRGSALGDPEDWAGVGSFAVLLRAQEANIGQGLALAPYFSELAVFGQKGVQFWSMDPDPDLNQYQRTLAREGLIAPRAVQGFGDGDVMFLARSGVRSLQARDSSNVARIGDVGSPIDGFLRPILRQAGQTGSAVPEASAMIHHLTGQLWFAIGRSIYVLSNHPESKVLAWSQFELDSPTPEDSDGWIEDMAEINGTVMVRNRAREVFVLGGPLYDQYDDTSVEVETPSLSFGTPGNMKAITGLDVACSGEWRISVSFDQPNIDDVTGDPLPIAWEVVATVKGSTYGYHRIPIAAQATHIAVKAVSLNDGQAKLGEMLVHFQKESSS